jgi:hypothetical protein
MDDERKKALLLASSIAVIVALLYVKKYGNTQENRNVVGIFACVTYAYAIYMMLTDRKMNSIYYGTIVALGLVYAYMITPGTENYGGPIKNTRKIPMTDCYKFCDNNYGMCTHMYPHDNVGKCDAQWRACRAECYFPNTQRMY